MTDHDAAATAPAANEPTPSALDVTQWEYLAVTMDETGHYVVESKWDATPPDDFEPHGGTYNNRTWASINDLGEVGWELVSVQFFPDREGTAFFKRPVYVASSETTIVGEPISVTVEHFTDEATHDWIAAERRAPYED